MNLGELLLQKSQELLPLHVSLQIPLAVLGLHDIAAPLSFRAAPLPRNKSERFIFSKNTPSNFLGQIPYQPSPPLAAP